LALGTFFFLLESVVGKARPQKILRAGFRLDIVYWFIAPFLKILTRMALIIPASLLLLLGVTTPEVLKAGLYQGFGPLIQQPAWLQAVQIIFLVDLSGYWIHRLFHTGRWWPFHSIHHSSEAVDWLAAVRVHPVNELVDKIAQVTPVLLLGYNPAVTMGVVPILTLYAIYLHANVNWDNGPLRAVISSPVFHRWHHSNAPAARNKNFAGLFPIWDILFNTYYMPKELRPETFGIDEELPQSYHGQVLAPFSALSRRQERGQHTPAA
ncbi:MAG: sterol desaturase family protein, partial [Verrucomicrobia bacterium]|nr:sterol desaturase family protein [Verrucomicrobiota bacterium]